MLASFGLTSGGVPDESTLRKLFSRLEMPMPSTGHWVYGCGHGRSSPASAGSSP